MIRNIAVHIRIRSNQNVIPYFYVSYNGGIDPYPNLISDCRTSLSRPSIFLPYRNTFMNVAVPTHLRVYVDCNTIGMTDI